MHETVVYDREALFAQIWERPLREVCNDYRISDVQLAKVCEQLHVPRPPRGFWLSKNTNRERPPLPPIKNGEPSRIIVERPKKILRELAEEPHADVPPEVTLFVKRAIALKDVRVPPHVPRLHAFVADDDRTRHGARSRMLRSVGDGNAHRAQRIAHVLLATLAELGATLAICREPWRGQLHEGVVSATIGTVSVDFRLRESLEHRQDVDHSAPVDHADTRLLELEIVGRAGAVLPRRRWTETDTSKLEDLLHDVVIGIARAAAIIAMTEAPRREAAAARRRADEEQARRERLRQIEKAIVVDVGERAQMLLVADRLQAFLSEHGATLKERAAPWPEWSAWATAYAATLSKDARDRPLPPHAADFLAAPRS